MAVRIPIKIININIILIEGIIFIEHKAKYYKLKVKKNSTSKPRAFLKRNKIYVWSGNEHLMGVFTFKETVVDIVNSPVA